MDFLLCDVNKLSRGEIIVFVDCFDTVADVHLVKDIAELVFGRLQGDVESGGDLLVEKALREQTHYFCLTVCEAEWNTGIVEHGSHIRKDFRQKYLSCEG